MTCFLYYTEVNTSFQYVFVKYFISTGMRSTIIRTTIHNCMKTSNSYDYVPVVWEQFETCAFILAQYTTIGAGVLTDIGRTQTRVT